MQAIQEVRDALAGLMVKASDNGHRDVAWLLRAQVDKLTDALAALAALRIESALVKKPAAAPRKAKLIALRPALNCLGKPMSPSFDPNYRMKYRTPAIPLPPNCKPVRSAVSPEQWASMVAAAQAEWKVFMAGAAEVQS